MAREHDPTRSTERLGATTRRGLLGSGAAASVAGCATDQPMSDATPATQSRTAEPAGTPLREEPQPTADPSAQATHVYDTAGRTHGELTGKNDAQVVIDAIADRVGHAGIVVPDPGYALDWEQQVDIPAGERGFTFLGDGMPELKINTGFSGTYAINKPATTDTQPSQMGYRVGGFYVIDRKYGENATEDNRIGYGTNANLEAGIVLDDVKESVVMPTVFLGCPGVLIKASNGWSNQNLIMKPSVKGPRGPAVKLENTVDNKRADQNWVFAPQFADDTQHEDSDVVAYVDEGNDNNWMYTRTETCHTSHRMVECSTYTITEGDWDRTHKHEFSVKEEGNAEGRIEVRSSNRYKKMRLIGNNTLVSGVGESSLRSTANPDPSPTDVFDSLKRTTMANSLSSLGLRDNSSGGSVSLHSTAFNHPFLELSTDGSTNSTATVDLGEGALKDQAMPKVAFTLNQPNASDRQDVVVRTGYFVDEGNRAELVYDPTNELGNHGSGNWFFELAEGGSITKRVDVGVAGTEDQAVALNREETRDNVGRWSAIVDKHNEAVALMDSKNVGKGTWRLSVETLTGSSKHWFIKAKGGMRFYRF